MHLFEAVIDGWDSWEKVYQSKQAFARLVAAIVKKEGLAACPIEGLTPGTNAVFRCRAHVVKIFAPIESGLDTTSDFHGELAAMRHAFSCGVPTPELVCSGEVADRYLFRYLVMKHIDGVDAGAVLPTYAQQRQADFVAALKAALHRLHVPAPGWQAMVDLQARAIHNERLAGLAPSLLRELAACATAQTGEAAVFVHGDLTGENILIRADGSFVLIDFADSVLAPESYELPPIVFELFKSDHFLVRAFAGDEAHSNFVDRLVRGLALHDFCGNFLKEYFAREGIAVTSVTSLATLRTMLLHHLFEPTI